jgi:two-component system sensor histidine kinase EvgS
MLERLDLEPVLAEDGGVALRMIEAGEKFDLLLTDCHMPVLDGFALTRAVRKREAELGQARMPIVALSASVMIEEQRRCFDSGMDDFLHKPIDPRKLRMMMTRWIGADPDSVAQEEAASAANDALAVFDFSPYAELFEPDEARRIAQDYAATTRQQLDALYRAIEEGDLKTAGRNAHAVAGGSLTIGARQLGEAARTVEMALFGGDLEAARAELPQLEPSFAAVEERIAQL